MVNLIKILNKYLQIMKLSFLAILIQKKLIIFQYIYLIKIKHNMMYFF